MKEIKAKGKESIEENESEPVTLNVKNRKFEFVKKNKTKIRSSKRKKQSRNRKLDVNENNNYAYVPNAPRKRCERCRSSYHLTYACKKTNDYVSEEPELFYDPFVPLNHSDYPFCSNLDYKPCKMNVITSCFNLRR